MLSGLQIASYFRDNKLEVTTGNKKVTKVVTPDGHLLYIKNNVLDKPLVLPPSQLKNRVSIDSIKELSVNWEGVHNANFTGYQKKLKKGNSESPYGFDVEVKDESALDELLKILSPAYVKSSHVLDDIFEGQHTIPSDTTKKAVIDSRVGQGRFRLDLIGLWGACAITKTTRLEMLKASHIKPWKDSDNNERLDKFNGFLLSPNIDSAFDVGFISFEDTGEIIISSTFTEADKFSIHPKMKLKRVFEENKPYLAYHRKNVFQGTP